jgi:hypothetical protein
VSSVCVSFVFVSSMCSDGVYVRKGGAGPTSGEHVPIRPNGRDTAPVRDAHRRMVRLHVHTHAHVHT